ncbi:MAG TPA: membrane protein insertion efficiency factor YidD [Candidatus Limiplasma stercoravium]|nr:membrane protein insertion efficiency factor YidD [Candidatus Limiplasma stercoravium]
MKALLLWLIRFYQRHISVHTPPCCRFQPTCSQYALTAIERYGALRGGLMAAWRLVRCNPLCKGGYDPVPDVTDTIIRRE